MEALLESINQLNWWAVLAAVLSTLPVGYVWYDVKVGFGKSWMKLVGLKEKDMTDTSGMPKTFSVMLLTSLVTAVFLASMLHQFGVSGYVESLWFGLVTGLVLRGGAHFIHNGFAKRSDRLTAIDVGHDMASIAVMCVILGVWG